MKRVSRPIWTQYLLCEGKETSTGNIYAVKFGGSSGSYCADGIMGIQMNS